MNPGTKSSSPPSSSDNSEPLSFEKVWRMFQDTRDLFTEQAKESDRKLKEAAEQVRETSREVAKIDLQFNTQWGKFVESLVKGDLVRLLKEKQIPIDRTYQRMRRRTGEINYEFDIVAENGEEIVVVEVKTTLKSEAIRQFLYKLQHIKEWIPDFKDKVIYGAVAFIHTEENAIAHAEHCGLFIIKATGNSSSIINSDKFVPKIF